MKTNLTQRFCHLGKIIDNPQYIANAFNIYFINIGPSITEQIHFRGSHKTYLSIVDRLTYLMDQGKIHVLPNIYIDLSKAFETLNFEILLDKLAHYGVLGKANSLIHSYLTNRKQIVVYETTQSIPLIVKSRIPQGLILGPLLFSIYINDLQNFTNVFGLIMYYADDTTLFFLVLTT